MARYTHTIEQFFKVKSRSGDEILCYCPWHDDGSGHLYANDVKGVYLCMSCGAKGKIDNLDSIPRIVVGSDDVREKIKRMRAGRQVQKFYPETWLAQYDVPCTYWTEERGLPKETVEQFRLGFDPFTGHATMPLRDHRGRILGVTHRHLDGSKPKYQHPKGFPVGGHLYGAWLLRDHRTVALVEGQVDAIRGWSYDVPALGLMGNRITKDQIKVLQHKNVRSAVLMLDRDAAGVNGVLSIHDALMGSGIRMRVGWYRPYWFNVKDPDNLTRARYRKMYFSALNPYEWGEWMLNG